MECPNCNGTGYGFDDECPECGGSGHVADEQQAYGTDCRNGRCDV